MTDLATLYAVFLGISEERIHIRDVPVYKEAWYILTRIARHRSLRACGDDTIAIFDFATLVSCYRMGVRIYSDDGLSDVKREPVWVLLCIPIS